MTKPFAIYSGLLLAVVTVVATLVYALPHVPSAHICCSAVDNAVLNVLSEHNYRELDSSQLGNLRGWAGTLKDKEERDAYFMWIDHELKTRSDKWQAEEAQKMLVPFPPTPKCNALFGC